MVISDPTSFAASRGGELAPSKPRDPLWYQNAIIYQMHVRSYFDSNGDGIGDFLGLTAKLDYLQDLGVTALWLLPFYPSPLRDDGYDTADYTEVNPIYGTLHEFETFLAEAHRRGLRVITELVLNHTSDQHPWFQRARRAPPDSALRNYYVWSDDPQKYPEVRVIFQDFEASNWTWDPIAKSYYWHRFYAHQPDLNFDSPDVHRATFEALDFWLKKGVDGLRLDAIPYLYEREGTNGENLPETHAYLRKLRKHVDETFADRMLLAEANQWPEDAAAYFGKGDECHMAFHFPLMPRLFMAVRMEERFPIIDILQQTPVIPDTSQWALFLRNHDELTLEMVTDEERDYMYRLYAQEPQMRINLGIRRRLAPLLENQRAKIELMNGLLFSLPGTPVIYYGDEIGMGDNIYLGDRNGVRTPMQWNSERNAGFSKANPQRLFLPAIIDPEYHFQAVNVEAQQANPHSLLWWMKRLIALRKRHQAFGRGALQFIASENPKVLAFVRRFQDERILVVANLSRLPQYVELDLSEFQGLVPVEMFGRTPFATIVSHPYTLSLGGYGFLWFNLSAPAKAHNSEETMEHPLLTVSESWDRIFAAPEKVPLQEILAGYLARRPWFQGKGRTIDEVTVRDVISIVADDHSARVVLIDCKYNDGDSDCYFVPIGYAAGAEGEKLKQRRPQRILARLQVVEESASAQAAASSEAAPGYLYDCLGETPLAWSLIEAISKREQFRGAIGALQGEPLSGLEQFLEPSMSHVEPTPFSAAAGSPALVYGDRLFLKVFRRLEPGINPEFEVGRFLNERTEFRHTPPIAGLLEYRQPRQDPAALAVVEGYIVNQGTVWQHSLDALGRFYEQARTRGRLPEAAHLLHRSPIAMLDQEVPELAQDVFGSYLETVRLLGQRTAELHAALATGADAAFAPEPFTLLYQRSLYQSLRGQFGRAFRQLRGQLKELPAEVRSVAETVLAAEERFIRRGERIFERRIDAQRIRCHGDYDMTKVLHTGNDLVIFGLEGDITRPLSDRRRKRTVMSDVATMLFSFRYVTEAALERSTVRPEDLAHLESWMHYWQEWVSAVFLKSYLQRLPEKLLPTNRTDLEVLLDVQLLKRAGQNVQLDLLYRPERLVIPLKSLARLAAEMDGEPPDTPAYG
ncbi:MAG TPA: maltose alpha-D-glucosyltransferase [Pirellulales bacterium]|jgi:maltose alpha-D-glucosyltransferase/alpha-amylase|nr:maltose alpha-D-glucosyltransferase [Pirellulales bacterium]